MPDAVAAFSAGEIIIPLFQAGQSEYAPSFPKEASP